MIDFNMLFHWFNMLAGNSIPVWEDKDEIGNFRMFEMLLKKYVYQDY